MTYADFKGQVSIWWNDVKNNPLKGIGWVCLMVVVAGIIAMATGYGNVLGSRLAGEQKTSTASTTTNCVGGNGGNGGYVAGTIPPDIVVKIDHCSVVVGKGGESGESGGSSSLVCYDSRGHIIYSAFVSGGGAGGTGCGTVIENPKGQ